MDSMDGHGIAAALRQNATMRYLYITFHDKHRVPLKGTGEQAIADALSENSTLETLEMRSGNITAEDVRAIARALRKNSTLLRLRVVSKKIFPISWSLGKL